MRDEPAQSFPIWLIIGVDLLMARRLSAVFVLLSAFSAGCAASPEANDDNPGGAGAGGTGGREMNPGGGGMGGEASGGGMQGGTGGTGQAGTGGQAAPGGMGGQQSSGGGAGGPPAGSVIVRENFDGGNVGAQPSGWDNFVGWVKNGTNPNGQVLALVDDSRARSGTKSMHFKGGQQPAMITKALPDGTNKLYVRAYVYLSQKLGAVTETSANHETLIGIRATPGDASNEVRFGEIKGAIGTNEVPSDNISPRQDKWHKADGPSIAANAWTCVEVAFLGEGANHELHAWFNGTEVHAVTSPDQWNNGPLRANWLDGKFKEVMLGWHSFSGRNIDVWMDDVVVATSRVGCND